MSANVLAPTLNALGCRFSLVGALACALATPVQAEPARFRIDPAHSFPSFAVTHAGLSLHSGRFNATQGELLIDFAAKQGSVDITIAADSVDTGDAELEKQLRGANFFDAGNYPTLRFSSTQIEFSGDQPGAVHGTLTLLGVTKPLTLTIERFQCGVHPLLRTYVCGANARAKLRRSDFGMSKFLSMVGDEVEITLQVEAVRESAADIVERAGRPGR